MRVYAFKTGLSIHNEALKIESGLNEDFYSLQVVFDSTIKEIDEKDISFFIKIQIPVSAIVSDSFLKVVKIKDSEQTANLFLVNLDDTSSGYIVKTTENSVEIGESYNMDTLVSSEIEYLGEPTAFNNTVTRVPNCPPQNGYLA